MQSPEWATPYGVKKYGTVGRAVRVHLDSKTWKPSRPAQLSFDAKITKCSDPMRVKIGHRKLSSHETKDWLVGAIDVFTLEGDVTLDMVTILDPSVDVSEFAKAEGVRAEEL